MANTEINYYNHGGKHWNKSLFFGWIRNNIKQKDLQDYKEHTPSPTKKQQHKPRHITPKPSTKTKTKTNYTTPRETTLESRKGKGRWLLSRSVQRPCPVIDKVIVQTKIPAAHTEPSKPRVPNNNRSFLRIQWK